MIGAITTGILAAILLAVILWYVVVGKGHSAIEGNYKKRIETYNKEIEIKLNEKQAIERDIQLKQKEKQAAEEAVNATRKEITSTAVELQKQVDAVEAAKKENEVAAQKGDALIANAKNSCNESNAKLAEIERAIKDGKAEFDKGVENIKNIKEQQASEMSKLNQIKDNFRVATLRTDKSFTAPCSKINISEKDRMDVNELEHYCEGMKCENEVKKALYTVYVQDEVDRIIKEAKAAGVCGIYRIFREVDGKQISYVGQSVNIGERGKQHAKRAWGIDNVGRIKLYAAMIDSGIEQWKGEIVERVDDRDKLNEREVYGGDFYCCKEAGLNSKLG